MISPNATAIASRNRVRHFEGQQDLVPLWIAEPYVELSPAIQAAIADRAATGWYGYEARSERLVGSFWDWMKTRHQWDGAGLHAEVSSSVGTSIAVTIEMHSDEGDGVIIQPPVFTEFRQMIRRSGRRVIRNPLVFAEGRYQMNLADLADRAADPRNRIMILCNPHNPVGRAWIAEELTAVARICAENDVVLISDEIHADVVIGGSRFTPIADTPGSRNCRWVSTHGPIKTFGLAGVCDSLLITRDEELAQAFKAVRSRYHFSRNNVLGLAAFDAAYREGGRWLDGFLNLIESNLALLQERLPAEVRVIQPESTYLAWLDFTALGFDAPDLSRWLPTSARVALSPGHWFGREGAGFARMTVAAPPAMISEAADRIRGAVEVLRG